MASSPQQNGRAARVPLRGTGSSAASLRGNDPRARRNAQALTDPALVKLPLGVDSRGVLELRLDGPVNLTPNGELTVLVGAPFAVSAGSPYKIVLQIESASLQLIDGQLAARPEARHVKSNGLGSSRTLADELSAVHDLQRAHDERLVAEERQTDTSRQRSARRSRERVASRQDLQVVSRRSFR